MGKDQKRKAHGLDVKKNQRAKQKEREAQADALLREEWTPEKWAALPDAPPVVPRHR